MIISTYKDECPFYAPTRWSTGVSSTPEFVHTIRLAMEERPTMSVFLMMKALAKVFGAVKLTSITAKVSVTTSCMS